MTKTIGIKRTNPLGKIELPIPIKDPPNIRKNIDAESP